MEKWLELLKGERDKKGAWDLFYVLGVVGAVLIAQFVGNSMMTQLLSSQPRLYKYLPVLVGCNILLNAVLLIACVYVGVKGVEKRGFKSLGLVFGKCGIKSYFKGAFIGIIMLAAVVAIIALGGGITFEVRGIAKSQYVSFGLIIVAWIVQGISEEILIRGYLFTRLSVRRGVGIGIIVSSVCFGLLHSMNMGSSGIAILNVSLSSIFLALYVLRTGNVWGVCGWHTAWNLIQGNILGLNVSGNQVAVAGEVWRGTMQSRNTLLTGGEFGIEASLATTLIMLAGIILNLFIYSEREVGSQEV